MNVLVVSRIYQNYEDRIRSLETRVDDNRNSQISALTDRVTDISSKVCAIFTKNMNKW